MKHTDNQRPYDVIQKVANMLQHTQMFGELEKLTASDLIKVCRACMDSGWDIYPDQLTDIEIAFIKANQVTAFRDSVERRGEAGDL